MIELELSSRATMLLALTLAGCEGVRTSDPAPDAASAEAVVADATADAPTAGEAILAGAARWLGVTVHERIETIRAVADVSVAERRFETLILSARDGSARWWQSEGIHAGLHPSGPWLEASGPEDTRELPPGLQSALRGHELHATVLMPDTRYRDPTYLGETTFGSTEALEVTVQDEWDGTWSLFFAKRDTVPLGMRREGVVDVYLADWESRGGLRLFRAANFDDHTDIFEYRYRVLELNEVDAEEFLPGG